MPDMIDQNESYAEALRLLEAGDLNRAAELFEVLVSGIPDARYFAAYGICRQKTGHWQQAIKLFEKALALKPAYCEADWRNMLAASYLHDGQKQRAIEQWRIVSTMEPMYPSRDSPIDEAKKKLKDHGG
jgi:tetratricopeptide (TPR) repeat protein